MKEMTIFKGLSAFPLTPIDGEGRVQTETLGRMLDQFNGAAVASIGLLGSTGSYAYLSRSERLRAVRAAVEAVGGKIPVVVGVGAVRTDEAVALAEDTRDAGADGLLLAPVSYQILTENEVYDLFSAVAAAGKLPLCIYNNPTTTKFTFGDAMIERLAKLGYIEAVKMPLAANGDFAEEVNRLRALTSESFAIGYSGDWGAADALLAGADAWYSVVAGLLPKPAGRLTQAAIAGDAVEAKRINDGFAPLWTIFKEFGSYRVMYVLADLLGFGKLAPPRPVQLPAAAARERIEGALHQVLLI